MSERDRLTELAKRRGFFFPTAEAYGGTAGFYTYGPTGAALKANIEDAWRERFAVREGHMEIESPTVMAEPVFDASGHLETFDDMLVRCPDCGASHRADHLVEAATGIEDAESLDPEGIADLLAEHAIQCPNCGASLAEEPVDEFNLMFETNIGPGTGSPGYLRPETAQGIFVEFPRLKEYARNQLPFGVTQVGPAYRNEISPRQGLIRLRELTQAELELFVDPETDEPPLDDVSHVELPLYSATAQGADGDSIEMVPAGDAVENGTIGSEWIGYYLAISMSFFEQIGLDLDRFRYRQHLTGERAHYATDCWDAETEVDGDWIEITGFAYRSDYDLRKHEEYSDDEFTVFKPYEEPKTVEGATVDPDMSTLGPEFGDDATAVADALESLAARDPSAFEAESVQVEVDGETYTVSTDVAGFEVTTETIQGEHRHPHVVEPSFGIDRLVYSVVAHRYREDELAGERRTYLDLPPAIAPTFVGVFPLMDRDGLGDLAADLADRLRSAGFAVAYDDAGSIGRRYRRQDEIGTPYCVTVDYDTLEDDTVTVRDRDTAAQRRVPMDELPGLLGDLRDGDQRFDEVGVPIADS